jgi:hypothetical protein
MRVFICNRSIDKVEASTVVADLVLKSRNSIAVQQEREHHVNWQSRVEKKMQESDFVIFLLGHDTFTSDQMKWEYAKAKDLNKQIIGIKIPRTSEESILYCQGYQVFDDCEQAFDFLKKIYEDSRKLLQDQYKMMVSSTEKVTESRMKVNNLFLTITSSIISVAFVLGKALGFTVTAMIGMIILTTLAFLVSFFWQKLVYSYGQLNTGKFKVIDKIEKQLRTNMFEDEWKILTQEIKYEPNSRTEIKVITYFRISIVVIAVAELAYLYYILIPLPYMCSC